MRKASTLPGLAARFKPLDGFGALNATLFVGLAATTYWDRFRAFRPQGNFAEFFVYGTVIFLAILVGWWALRRFPFTLFALVTLELGILLHFAAGLTRAGGARLYDVELGVSLFDYPLRFDKIVHLFNGFAGCIAVMEVAYFMKIRVPRGLTFFVCMSVLGMGALVEVVEYFVVKTVPHNGVGDYDNNMTDLVANLLGCLLFALTRTTLQKVGVRSEMLRLSVSKGAE